MPEFAIEIPVESGVVPQACSLTFRKDPPKLKILRNLSERIPILVESGIPNSRIYVILLNVALFVQKLPNSARKWNRKLENGCSLFEFKLEDQGELVW